jgi:lysyl-tRNA synthetase class 1
LGRPPQHGIPVSFALLLNLVGASNAGTKEALWGFIRNYAPGATPETDPELDRLAGFVIRYFHDRERPLRRFREPDEAERAAMLDLYQRLGEMNDSHDAESLQTLAYEIGKAHTFENLRDWFKALYEVLLGASQGPRFGSFIALYGVEKTRALIAEKLGLSQEAKEPAKSKP